MLDEAQGAIWRSRVLGPYVEIVLAAGDVPGAASAAEELAAFASEIGTPLLRAISGTATGRVRLAEREPRPALTLLRRAWREWRDLEIPYEAARVRVLIAQACRALGDDDGAEMELDAARAVFEELGAAPELARLPVLFGADERTTAGGLTAREVEVLRLLATGATNRAIAKDLMISEKTVATHISHIFTKLQLPSRAAATAYAYAHRLI